MLKLSIVSPRVKSKIFVTNVLEHRQAVDTKAETHNKRNVLFELCSA